MPTVLRDSCELIQCLEGIKLPSNCLLVTADVSSLYANIDSKNAIIALDPLLWEGKVTQTALLVQLTRLVFEINFLNKNLAREHHIVCKKFALSLTLHRHKFINVIFNNEHSFDFIKLY